MRFAQIHTKAIHMNAIRMKEIYMEEIHTRNQGCTQRRNGVVEYGQVTGTVMNRTKSQVSQAASTCLLNFGDL